MFGGPLSTCDPGKAPVSRRVLAALSLILLAGCGPWPAPSGRPTRHPSTSSTPAPPSTTSTVTPPSSTTTTQPPRTGCFKLPSACGYPDGTNTGYKPTGVTTTTTGVSYNGDGDFDALTAGAVIDGKVINGCVNIKAPNVTIKRSVVKGCGSYFNLRLYPGAGGFVIEDTEVDGSGAVNNAAMVDDGVGPVTMRRVNMHNVADGPHPGEHWLIVDSWIHDLTRCDVCHNDTIQSLGANDVTVRHNTLENLAGTTKDGGMNSVVRIATEQGPVSGFVVQDNLLAGGNYAVQVRSQGSGAPQGVQVLNNRIARGTTPDSQPYPRFGPYDFTDVPTAVWTGNVWDDTGQSIP